HNPVAPQRAPREVQPEAGRAAAQEQERPAADVLPRAVPPQPDALDPLAAAADEVAPQPYRRQREQRTEDLPRELGTLRHRGHRDAAKGSLEQAEDREDRAREQRERQDDERLLTEK